VTGRAGAGEAALLLAASVQRGGFDLRLQLEVAAGEVVGVVGPNGAGKTTLLRMVAGLTPATRGSVTVGGRVVDDAMSGSFEPPDRRSVSYVFQDHRLFPHLKVVDNVAFPWRSAGLSRAASRAKARHWLERFDLVALAEHKPGRLSGGQAQRVALARALAAAPQVLLLDEPLAALDAQTRLDVRGELRRHLDDYDGACLLVTHDPLEALVLADRLVVLEAGRVSQVGTPAEVAQRPATSYVASLVGLNLYNATATGAQTVALDGGGAFTVAALPTGGEVLVTVRPAAIAVYTERPAHGSPRNVWPATVENLELLTDRVRIQTRGKPDAIVDITPAAVAELRLVRGSDVWLAVKSTEIDVYAKAAA
jgi:molybdate transport system ATP-binding protein